MKKSVGKSAGNYRRKNLSIKFIGNYRSKNPSIIIDQKIHRFKLSTDFIDGF